MIKEAIAIVAEGTSLSVEQAQTVMLEILEGRATPAQFGALMMALRLKGETPGELTGFATAMRTKVMPVATSQPVVDTCGTGGDGTHSFNISTAAAIVVSAAGVPVAKHGNRAMSSSCGSADVLEGLGVPITLGPVQVARSIDMVGFGFMFAPMYHPSMKFAAPLRREIGTRTVFNILGPLTNPAGARFQLIGVPNVYVGEKVAAALVGLGTDHALVVAGDGGTDELTLSGPSHVWEVRAGDVKRYTLEAADVGVQSHARDRIKGGDVATNVRIIHSILGGDEGAPTDAVLLNAGAALFAADQVRSIADGVTRAREAITSGVASTKLTDIVAAGKTL